MKNKLVNKLIKKDKKWQTKGKCAKLSFFVFCLRTIVFISETDYFMVEAIKYNQPKEGGFMKSLEISLFFRHKPGIFETERSKRN